MIIYEFSTWGSNGKPYIIKEVEVGLNSNNIRYWEDLGYEIEYTLNNGSAWDEYEEVVNITNSEGIYARIVTKDGKVISNVIKVQEGMMQSEDKISPIIRAVPGNGIGRTIYVTIFVTEYGTLLVKSCNANQILECLL